MRLGFTGVKKKRKMFLLYIEQASGHVLDEQLPAAGTPTELALAAREVIWYCSQVLLEWVVHVISTVDQEKCTSDYIKGNGFGWCCISVMTFEGRRVNHQHKDGSSSLVLTYTTWWTLGSKPHTVTSLGARVHKGRGKESMLFKVCDVPLCLWIIWSVDRNTHIHTRMYAFVYTHTHTHTLCNTCYWFPLCNKIV